MYWRQRVVDHPRGEHVLLAERLCAARRSGCATPFSNALLATLASVDCADAVLGHVALDLHGEELRRQHQAGLAVPGADAPLLGQRVERAGRVLVEADDERDLGAAGGLSIACAVISAEPPVAQPFLTLMNGTPVSPSTDTVVSALPAASEPPAAKSMSSQPRPASASAARAAMRGHLEARTRPSWRPNGWMPRPTIATSSCACPRRPERERHASSPPGAGISVSSIGHADPQARRDRTRSAAPRRAPRPGSST